ncbi:DUF5994 family protein [Streptomyces sp. NPDC102467]|uniref:DUF5994 family protein n=1 Tax=Streptomyces sp. NPDC102467 TaxID=3366179 RepID=UPI003816AF77
MSTTNDRPVIQPGHSDELPARLRLKDAGAPRGLLDGAWWPRSRDLSRELPCLAVTLDRVWARITHVAVNPLYWPVIPRKVPVPGHVIKVGWFTPELDPQVDLKGRWRWGCCRARTCPGAGAEVGCCCSPRTVGGQWRLRRVRWPVGAARPAG